MESRPVAAEPSPDSRGRHPVAETTSRSGMSLKRHKRDVASGSSPQAGCRLGSSPQAGCRLGSICRVGSPETGCCLCPPSSMHFGRFSRGVAQIEVAVHGFVGATVERDSFGLLPSPSWSFVARAPKAILTGLRVQPLLQSCACEIEGLGYEIVGWN